jgi:uroporphyrin-III C-methyltransferase
MTVWFVATGPGDPGLLTVQVESLLQTADAVAHEPAVAPDILSLIGTDAKVAEIDEGDHEPLAALAAAHRSVVHLSTGDRVALQAGGSDANALRRAGIEVVVVPVVLAALALPARRGIPVMARDLAPVLTIEAGPGLARPAARAGITVVTVPDLGAPTVDVTGAVTTLDLRASSGRTDAAEPSGAPR